MSSEPIEALPDEVGITDGNRLTVASREREDTARRIVERLLPDPTCRLTILRQLTASIACAHQCGTGQWGVTLAQQHIRLNVGMFTVCHIGRGYVWLALDLPAITSAALPRLEQLKGWKPQHYATFVPSAGGNIFCSELDEILPQIQEAHAQAVRAAAASTSRLHGSMRDAHSNGVLAYLRSEVAPDIPTPEYPAQAPLPDVDATTIEQALHNFDAQLRPQASWAEWEQNGNHDDAVVWQNQRYPVKEIVRLATGVERFHSLQARDYLQKRGFQIVPLRTQAPRVWIFQATPGQYNLADELRNYAVGDEDSWAVTTYYRQMHAGDTLLLWQSGPAAGIYAAGELISDPYQRDWQPDQETLERQPYQRSKWWVNYRYTHIFEQPLMRTKIRSHPILGKMEIFDNPRGTNFQVKPEEWQELTALLNLDIQPSINVRDLLYEQLTARGLHFTPWQIATFYTALQAKGFVILSGISGTGKTKLAQHFAGLLPQPATGAQPVETEGIAIALKPYMYKYNRLTIPKQATRLFDPPAPGETKDVRLSFDGKHQVCRLTHAVYSDTEYIVLMLRGAAREWFETTFTEGDGETLTLEPEFDADQNLAGFKLFKGVKPVSAPSVVHNGANRQTADANALFIAVRPDWRDSKSLLGYYNPLTGVYVWTDFLRFLVRAVQSYEEQDCLAWFVILDEMNLARVEYYFADLLSVLESGRTEAGWTREGLRFDYPETAEGALPRRELHLPPNLYFVGTVNVDETTHAFSPKVLDRAFTIEFVEADFTTYPPQGGAPAFDVSGQLQRALLHQFTDNGRFRRVDKARIAGHVAAHPRVRDELQRLNAQLQRFSMHFGYRVFDEIVSFLAAAEQNGLFADMGGASEAFDAAVLMKVLPKFHGSRGKLEAPLRAILGWCLNPAAPAGEAIAKELEHVESGLDAVTRLSSLHYAYQRTAERVIRMLHALYTDGFASFG